MKHYLDFCVCSICYNWNRNFLLNGISVFCYVQGVKVEIVLGIKTKGTRRGKGTSYTDGKDYALVVWLHSQLERKMEQGIVVIFITHE